MAQPNRWRISKSDKLFFPAEGITKRQVLDYYRLAAPWLLPFLRDRPCALERWPDGIGPQAKHFWQKNTPAYFPSWIPRAAVASATGQSVNYTVINDEETLLYLVNQGVLTFHPWLSRVAKLDRPDLVVFDLDPGRASLAAAAAVALALRDALTTQDCETAVKTSGQSGLHVLAPWRGRGCYDDAREWARTVAEGIVRQIPDTATLQRLNTTHIDRVYIDVLQNARGHHVVPPYVLRPLPGAPVSMPLRWTELTDELNPADFNITTAPPQFARRHKLLAPILDSLGSQS